MSTVMSPEPTINPPPEPLRRDSTWSTSSSMFSNMTGTDTGGGGIPTFFTIFQDAARYGDVLVEDYEEDTASDTSSVTLNTPSTGPTDQLGDVVIESKHFDDVATPVETPVDIDANINSLTSRLVQLSVNNFNASSTGLDGSLTESTAVSSDAASEISNTSSQKKELSDQIIPILVNEFGPLAEDDEEEILIAEADGSFFQDVAILGVIHLTTHRLVFHASLLSTRPDLLPSSQILKAGPALIHREGLKRKKRLWLELGPEMVSTFPDSTDEGRVRPLKTVLLSAIKEVAPVNPAEPNSLRFIFETPLGKHNAHVEFDDTESALSWRRELAGALYMFKHKRRGLLDTSVNSNQEQGVRIAIPLHRIQSFDTQSWANFATVITFNVGSSNEEESPPLATWRTHDTPADRGDHPHLPFPTHISSQEPNQETITIAFLQGLSAKTLESTIDEAKIRRSNSPSTLDNGDKVVVDFGELTFSDQVEVATSQDGAEKIKAKDVEVTARRYFALAHDEDIWYTRACIGKLTSCSGYIVISPRFICYWSKSLVSDHKYRFHAHDVNRARLPHANGKRLKKCVVANLLGGYGFVLEVRGHKDIFFEIRGEAMRDETVERINRTAEAARAAKVTAENDEKTRAERASQTVQCLDNFKKGGPLDAEDTAVGKLACLALAGTLQPLGNVQEILGRVQNRVVPKELVPHFPKTINLPPTLLHHLEQEHFVCLTIGSRGDVQPYIALCLGLKKEGHKVTIVTHEEYKSWIEGFGIAHSTAGGDPGALMKLSVEHKMFSPQFFKESLGHFRKWLDDLLVDSYHAVKDAGATILIESPSAMAGVHVAEALKIPYFRAFTMPWTRTVEYPHAFISPPEFVAGSFNFSTYVLFDNVFWRATAPQINRWRKRTLHLPSTDLETMQQTKIPFLYNFSPSVVSKPLDWSDTTIITGYWFLDNPELGWEPPVSLLEFMKKAREDGKPLVYIGFGSIVVEQPKAMTKSIVKAVLKSDVRAILSKGWSARMAVDESEPEVLLPPEIYSVDKIPHDWLFPQVDAALHHGGAGTTGASLRAGIPTLIKPWFGDQFFWSVRVTKLGAGLRVQSLASSDLAHALTKATTDRVIKEKARAVGEKIRGENGVRTAISALYMYLHKAGELRKSGGKTVVEAKRC